MMIARLSAWNRLKEYKDVKFISTVHDSIVLDTPDNLVYNISIELENVFKDIPKNFTKLFGVEYNLPMKGEVSYGRDMKHLITFDKDRYGNESN